MPAMKKAKRKRLKKRAFIGFTPSGAKRKIPDQRIFGKGDSLSVPDRATPLLEYREREWSDW